MNRRIDPYSVAERVMAEELKNHRKVQIVK
jgi:hypothetical protein